MVSGAERFTRLDPDFRATGMFVCQRVRAGDDETPRAHRWQAIERHRHPIGSGHVLMYKMQFRRRRADDGFDARRVLLGGRENLDPIAVRALLEPGHCVGGGRVVPVEFVGGGADLRKRAKGGEQEHGKCLAGRSKIVYADPMTKLDMVLERIRQLPQERQDALAIEMQFWLDFDSGSDPLTPEQWSEMDRRASGPDDFASAAEVDAFFRGHGA